MPLSEVLDALRSLAPEWLAEPWDQVGLHLGGSSQAIGGGLLCIDLTEAVVAEAVEKRCELIVAYHPPIFAPLQRLTDDGPWPQRRILAAIRAGLAVYSPHTALDAVRGGVCDWLAEIAAGGQRSIEASRPILPSRARRDEYKVIVFVPVADEAAVRKAMSEAGAGGVGDYRECSFSSPGTGGFLPVEGAHPTIGRVGERAEVDERRLEMLVPGRSLAAVLAAMRSAHPYEEPAADVIKLEAEPLVGSEQTGAGRLVELAQPVAPEALAARLKDALGTAVKLGHQGVKSVRTIAVCPGSGGKLFEEAAARGADAYLTGEMQHHQALDLVQAGKVVLLTGHTHSERPYLPVYRERIARTAAGGLRWHVSQADQAPLTLR